MLEVCQILNILQISSITASEWHSSYVSPLYNVTTCRARGREGPTDADCQSEYTQDDSQVKGVEVHVKNGVQQWTVPLTTEYRIVAMGAAGGHLPSLGASPLNKGARVDAIVNLTANASVDIAVGQMGQTPCDAKNTMVSATNKHSTHEFKTSFNLNTVMAIAAACHSSANESIDRALTLPGTGGGGATIVKLYVSPLDPLTFPETANRSSLPAVAAECSGQAVSINQWLLMVIRCRRLSQQQGMFMPVEEDSPPARNDFQSGQW